MRESKQQLPFDPFLGAHALQSMAAFVLLFHEPNGPVNRAGPTMRAAVEVLRTAKKWLDERDGALSSQRSFAGDLILLADANGVSLARETFAEILQASALALLAPPPLVRDSRLDDLHT